MASERKFYGWYLVAALWVIYLINVGYAMYGASVVNTFMIKDLDMSRKTLGLGFALFMLLQGLPGSLIAMMINKKGIRYTLCFGSLLIIIGSALMATVVSTPLMFFLVFGVIMGLGVGFGRVLCLQTGVTLWFNRKRALAMSIALTAAGVGGFIAAPTLVNVLALTGNSWRAGWFFIGGLSLLAFIISILFVKNKPSDLGQYPDGINPSQAKFEGASAAKGSNVFKTADEWTTSQALKTGSIWLIFIGSVGFYVPYLLCVSHGVAHFMDQGFTKEAAAMSIGVLTLFSIIGRLLGGAIGDKIEPRFIWSISLLILFAGVLTGMVATTQLHIYLYAVLVGVGFGAAFVCMPTLFANYYGPKAFASIMGTLFPLLTIFASSAPFIAGWIFDSMGSYRIAFIGASVFCLIGALTLLLAKPVKLQVTGRESVPVS